MTRWCDVEEEVWSIFYQICECDEKGELRGQWREASRYWYDVHEQAMEFPHGCMVQKVSLLNNEVDFREYLLVHPDFESSWQSSIEDVRAEIGATGDA